MNYKEKYNLWLSFDEQTKKELEKINDEKEIEDRFYKDLAFGTGGLRGIMGAGTNRMNSYTVGKATLGISRYLKSKYQGSLSVAIACDSRLNSKSFQKDAARIFASQGFKVFAYSDIVPVPVLSFTTRYHECNAGVMITASHNPKEYNGYKVYDDKGCQFCTQDAKNAIEFINEIDDYKNIYEGVKSFDEYVGEGAIELIYTEELNKFIAAVETQAAYQEKNNLKIVYTPLHGTGRFPVLAVLDGMDVTLLDSQKEPDGNFPTVKSPNPEDSGFNPCH